MARANESGHAMNVARFNVLVQLCKGYGAKYKPSQPAISLTSLQAKLTEAEAAMAALKDAKANFNNATNLRELGFKPLKTLATQILNLLASTEASQLTINDATTLKRMLQGTRAGGKGSKVSPAPAAQGAPEEETKRISVSQLGFSRQVENLQMLVNILSKEPLYKPNEEELRVEALTALVEKLKQLNTDAIDADRALKRARDERNTVLYDERTGLHSLTLSVKKYVRGAFGSTSVQAAEIGKLPFYNYG